MLEVDFPSGKYEQAVNRKFPVEQSAEHVWKTTEATVIRLKAIDPSYPAVEITIPEGGRPFYKRFNDMVGNEVQAVFFFVGYQLNGIRHYKKINTRTKKVIDRKDKAFPQ